MIKVTGPHDWNIVEAPTSLIKLSQRGLVGADRTAFIKRAGDTSAIFLPYLDSCKIASDEEPIHCIALHGFEKWGANYNGDCFRDAACTKYHDTFTKFARFYQDHKNRPHEGHPHFGVVKMSAYNPEMHRVELILALNKTKSAADRNGGFIAERSLQKLAKDGMFGVSMSCSVPYDECSWCHNKAATRREYCTESRCAAGGCANNLTRIVKVGNDVHHLAVHNDHPRWFDISDVGKPACQNAYALRADWLNKAAADAFHGIRGAKLAEELGMIAPLAVAVAQDLGEGWDSNVQTQLKLAGGLAKLAAQLQPSPIKLAFTSDAQGQLDLQALDLDAPSPEKVAGALGALADQRIILPLREFAKLSKRAELVPQTLPLLGGVYQRLLDAGDLERRIHTNSFIPYSKHASLRQKSAAAGVAAHYGLSEERVLERVHLAVLRGNEDFERHFKIADTITGAAEELARDYAVYQLAALTKIASFDDQFLLTTQFALYQNSAG